MNYYNTIFKNANCYFKNINGHVVRFILCFVFILAFQNNAAAQKRNCTVKVLSKKDSSQVEFATVSVTVLKKDKKLSQSFSTDQTGSLKFVTELPYTISINRMGFKAKEETITTATTQKIYLEPFAVALHEANVSTAQITERPVDASLYKVKVIGSKEIELQGATNLRDILLNQSNMRVSTDPILGSGIAIQGLSGQNVKILIDGVPVVGRENGNIDLSQINLANVEHIEVVEGPVSTVYGADALGGVINLITKTKHEYPLQVNLNSKYESIGTYNFDGGINFNKKQNNIYVFGGRNFFDGYDVVDTMRSQMWNPREQYFGGLDYTYQFTDAQVRYKCDYLNEKIYDKGVPVITPYDAFAFDNVYQTVRLGNTLFFNKKLSEKSKLDASASYQNYKRTKFDYYKNLVTLENTALQDYAGENTTTFDGTNIKANYSNFKFKKLNYLTGIDLNYETGQGAKIPEKETMGDYAAFASVEWLPLINLQIRPSARIAYNTVYGTHVIPALNAKYVIKTNTAIRFSIANGYRAPSLKELYLDFVDVNHNIHGNPNLTPENSINYQLSAEYTHFFNTSLIRVTPSVFYNDVKNTITLALNNSQANYYTYINSGMYRNYGYGLEGTFQNNALKFDAGFYNTATYNLLSQQYNLQNYFNTPEYRFAITYSNTAHNISTGVYFKYVGETKAYAVNNNNEAYLTQSAGYSFLDFTVSKKLYKAITITTGVKNILGVKNVSSSIVTGSPHGGGSGDLPVGTGAYFFAEIKLQLFKDCFKK